MNFSTVSPSHFNMSDRFHRVIALIDAANQEDPELELQGGKNYPRAYLYSLRMSETLQRFQPAASETLQIAARAQHIRRWQIPRSDYPAGRVGYLTWRRDLGQFHAEEAGKLMQQVGYDEDAIAEVQRLLTKRDLKRHADSQTLEDVACLVFIQHYLDDFATGQEREKLINILRKTWKKMSAEGQAAALALELSEASRNLIEEALGAKN